MFFCKKERFRHKKIFTVPPTWRAFGSFLRWSSFMKHTFCSRLIDSSAEKIHSFTYCEKTRVFISFLCMCRCLVSKRDKGRKVIGRCHQGVPELLLTGLVRMRIHA